MRIVSLILCLCAAFSGLAQGTFIYDQQSSTTEPPPGFVIEIQSHQPTGQSFTPTLSSVGFIRFYIEDSTFPSGPGATLHINLLGNSITGAVIGVSSPVVMPGGFSGYVNFLFPTPVSVTPGTTYYFQPFAESGNPRTQRLPDPYANGAAYFNGVVQPVTDLWFREGIIVPEPQAGLLVLTAGVTLHLCRRREGRRSSCASSV